MINWLKSIFTPKWEMVAKSKMGILYFDSKKRDEFHIYFLEEKYSGKRKVDCYYTGESSIARNLTKHTITRNKNEYSGNWIEWEKYGGELPKIIEGPSGNGRCPVYLPDQVIPEPEIPNPNPVNDKPEYSTNDNLIEVDFNKNK